jgi:hypothetical protein
MQKGLHYCTARDDALRMTVNMSSQRQLVQVNAETRTDDFLPAGTTRPVQIFLEKYVRRNETFRSGSKAVNVTRGT